MGIIWTFEWQLKYKLCTYIHVYIYIWGVNRHPWRLSGRFNRNEIN